MTGHGKLGATAAYGVVLLAALVCLSAIPSSAGGPPTYTLTLSGAHGQVSVGGVTHALPWSGSVTALHSVTLAALPDTGYHFTTWSGDLSGSTPSVTIAMDRSKAITAGFAPDRHTLSLSGSNGAVTVNGVACTLPWSGSFDYGTSVTLGATPAAGYHFAGWSGDLSGTATPTSLVIVGDSSVAADFAPNSYTLSLSGEGGSVRVDGTDHTLPWAGTFPYGTTVTLEALPDPGSHFTEWTGNLTGSANPTTLPIGGDRGVTASFALNTYPLSVTGSHGTVLIDGVSCSLPYTGTLTHGDIITLEALPDTGYHFVGWSGDLSGSTSSTLLTVDGEKRIEAQFAISAYTLELTGSHGAVAVDGVSHSLPWSGGFDYGAEVTLEAAPDTGYLFAYWSGNLSGSTTPTVVSMTGAKRIAANFTLRSCALSVSGVHGTITVDGVTHALPWADSYDYGAVVTLGATPATGYHFASWEGDLTGSASPTAVTLDGDKSIIADFAANTYTLTLTGNHGAVSVNGISQSLPYAGVFSYRERVTLAAEPEAGYRFTGWSGDLTKTTSPVTLTLDADKSVAVGFVANTYTLTLLGTHGEVTINGVAHALPWAGFYPYGTVVTLDVLPNTGYSFAGWSGDATGTAAPLDLTVDGTKSVVAGFVANTHTLALSGANGTVSVDGVSHPLPWSGTYSFGTVVILAASPDTGYHFAGWAGDLAGAATPSVLTIDGDRSVGAEFVINPYTLSLLGDHGTVSVNGSVHALPWSGGFEYGASLLLLAAPDVGYHFVDWSGEASGSDPAVSIMLVADASVTAGFAPNRYTVSLSGEHGAVLVDATSHSLPWSDGFDYGTSLTLAATPDTGYHFTGWGGGLSGSDSPTILAVEGDTSVAAGFAINSYTLSLSGEHGAVTVDGVSHALPWSGNFDHGTSVTLEAAPGTGYHFTAWSGDVAGVVSPATLVMDGNKSATAGFALNSYALTLSGTHGQVSVNGVSHALPWSGSFDHGTSITLAAAPDSGYHFTGWTGDLSGNDTPTGFTMESARNISAGFAVNRYALNLAGEHGTVTVNGESHPLPWSGTFDHGTEVALVPVADAHYHFTSWSGDLAGSANPASVTLERDQSIGVTFDLDRVTLSLTGSHGTVLVDGASHALPWSGDFAYGATVTLTAVPDAEYGFTEWGGDLSGTTSPATLTMEASKLVTVSFALGRYTLSLTGSHGAVAVSGVTHPLPWSGSFDYGTSITLAAVPDTGYHFTAWSGDVTGESSPATLTLEGDRSVSAAFAINSYTLSLTGSNGQVTVDGASHSLPWLGSFDHGVTVTLAATAETGYTFTGWSGDLTGTTNPVSLLMDRDKSVGVSFPADPATWEDGALSLPGYLAWGGHATFTLVATNAGTTPWDEGFSLWSTDGVGSPLDRWGLLSLPLPGTVLPGDSYTFTGQITAPPLSTIDYAAPVGDTQEGRTTALACDWQLQSGVGPADGGPAQGSIVISRFPDIQPGTDGAWARFWTEQLAGAVPFVVKGYGDGSYRPRATVDRASIAVYVARATRLPLPDQADGTVFSDVPADFWAAREIEACAAAGIVSGFRYQRYAPLDAVTRGQMAKLMAHGRQLLDPSFAIPHLTREEDAPFLDVSLGNSYMDFIAACKNGDLVRGYSDGTYRPNGTVTRDQLAAYVWRTFLRDWGNVIVLGGPAVTAVNPADVDYVGYTSASSATGEQHYAYIVIDAVRLHGIAAPVGVTFAFAPVGADGPSPSRTATLDQASLEAAAAAASASGEPYLAVSVPVPKLAPGSYNLSVTVSGYLVNQRQPFVYTVD